MRQYIIKKYLSVKTILHPSGGVSEQQKAVKSSFSSLCFAEEPSRTHGTVQVLQRLQLAREYQGNLWI